MGKCSFCWFELTSRSRDIKIVPADRALSRRNPRNCSKCFSPPCFKCFVLGDLTSKGLFKGVIIVGVCTGREWMQS